MKRSLKKMTSIITAFAAIAGAMMPAKQAEAAEITFLTQRQTRLEAGNDMFDFTVGDFNNDGNMNIFAIKKYNTGTGKIELHILDGASHYQSFLIEAGLPLELGDNFKFTVGDYDGDGRTDLYAIKKNAGAGSCEVHILDGSSNYSRFIEQRVIPLELASYWHFAVSDYNGDMKPDLYAIKASTSSNKFEVHILDGNSGYSHFLEQRVLPLENGEYSFCIGNYNSDDRPDLYALKKYRTGTGTTEIHILNGANGYQSFLLQSGVNLETGDNFVFAAYDYNNSGCDDLVAIKRRAVSKTEIHVLNVSRNNGKRNPNTHETSLHSPVPSGSKFSIKTPDGSWYGYHDINRNVSAGTPVYAIADGTVTFKQAYRTYNGIQKLSSYGNFIEFKSSDGVYSAKYCHLNGFNGAGQVIRSSSTVCVSGSTGVHIIGTKSVKRGEVIGYIGTTGNSSNIHLHFELRKNGSRIDPASVIDGLT